MEAVNIPANPRPEDLMEFKPIESAILADESGVHEWTRCHLTPKGREANAKPAPPGQLCLICGATATTHSLLLELDSLKPQKIYMPVLMLTCPEHTGQFTVDDLSPRGYLWKG